MSVVWGFVKFKADAEKCYREIEALGECKPEEIVEYAKHTDTELHKCFEWDDTKAAERWRPVLARLNRFTGWTADVTIRYLEGGTDGLEQIVQIIQLAGFGLGIGSGRSSGYGRYSVSPEVIA